MNSRRGVRALPPNPTAHHHFTKLISSLGQEMVSIGETTYFTLSASTGDLGWSLDTLLKWTPKDVSIAQEIWLIFINNYKLMSSLGLKVSTYLTQNNQFFMCSYECIPIWILM